MDEQPLGLSNDQQPVYHQFNPEQQGEQTPASISGPPSEQAMGVAGDTWAYPQQPLEPGRGGVLGQPPLAASEQFGPGVPARPRRSGLRTGALFALFALLLVVFGTGLFAGWQFGHTGSLIGSPSSFQPGNNAPVSIPPLTGTNVDTVREVVINKVQPGVVQIDVVSASQHALGSGVIIDGRGYIITNNHVVTNATSIQVTLADGSTLTAKIVGTDPADDLAVIKVTPPSAGLSVVSLADSSQVRVGQEVLAIGSPLGNAETVTSGIVSALSRTISEGQNGPTIPDAIQTDAPINPGNSGGALVDLQGNLVGIPTLNAIDTEFNTPANGLGFA
ncbi:MAG: S1C family serine protease, partial [Ktedonobacteraceae bacterium]